jgi:hypothetical protein
MDTNNIKTKATMSKNKKITTVVIIVVAIILSFYTGMKYGQSKMASVRPANFPQAGNRNVGGNNRQNMGSTTRGMMPQNTSGTVQE